MKLRLIIFLFVAFLLLTVLTPAVAQDDDSPLFEDIHVAFSLSGATNVRSTPSTENPAIGTLSEGQQVQLLDEITDGQSVNGNSLWYQVELDDGSEGYVWSGALGQVETERRCLRFEEAPLDEIWLVHRNTERLIALSSESGRFIGGGLAGGQPLLWSTLIPPEQLLNAVSGLAADTVVPITDAATCKVVGAIVEQRGFHYLAVRQVPGSLDIRFVIADYTGEVYPADAPTLAAISAVLEAERDEAEELLADQQNRIALLQGEKIAFTALLEGTRTDAYPSGRSRIFLISPDGSHYGRLTENPGIDFYEQGSGWSPDGRYITYSHSSASGNLNLTVFDIATGIQRAIIAEYRAGVHVYNPAWSPDGQDLAVIRWSWPNGRPARRDLGVLSADTSRIEADFMVRNLTIGEWRDCDDLWIEDIKWSPTGEQIAFTASGCEPDDPEGLYVYVIRRDGENLRRLGTGSYFDWSYDGQQLVISAYGRNVRLIHEDGTGEHPLIPGAGDDEYVGFPAWSPTDNRIAYARNGALHMRDTTTGRDNRILEDAYGGTIVWSPDSRRLAFTSFLGNDWHINLSVVDADGGNRVQLLNDIEFASDFDLAWVPAHVSSDTE